MCIRFTIMMMMVCTGGTKPPANKRGVNAFDGNTQSVQHLCRQRIVRGQNAFFTKPSRPMEIAELIACRPPGDCVSTRLQEKQVFFLGFDDDRGIVIKAQHIPVL